MRVTSNRPDAERRLFAFFAQALRRLGAKVERSTTENLVRRVGPPGAIPWPLPTTGAEIPPVAVVVQVQGLPNLIHEVGHMVLRRVLDDDHGIDYQAIPFDLHSPQGRAVLWEEMACCVLSCGFPAPVRTGEAWAAVDAWFREQVEIQPVFYGLEDNPEAFWDQVAALYDVASRDCESVVSLAFDRAHALLRWAGAPAAVAAPGERLSFRTLLRRARRPGT